jgi:hypothetical protein
VSRARIGARALILGRCTDSRAAENRQKVLATENAPGLGWRALVRAHRGHPSKEDAMNTIAVAVTPVAVILRDPMGTPGLLG